MEIRKQKRDETVSKRRNLNAAGSGAESEEEGGIDSAVSPPRCSLPTLAHARNAGATPGYDPRRILGPARSPARCDD